MRRSKRGGHGTGPCAPTTRNPTPAAGCSYPQQYPRNAVGKFPDPISNTQWERNSPQQRSATVAKVDVYLDDFVSVVQGGPTERRKMSRHIFPSIDRVFRPNNKGDTHHKDPISWNKLGKGDAVWSTQKTVLGWNLDTATHLLLLPAKRSSKVNDELAALSPSARTASLKRWQTILGFLRSIIPAVPGARGKKGGSTH